MTKGNCHHLNVAFLKPNFRQSLLDSELSVLWLQGPEQLGQSEHENPADFRLDLILGVI